MIDSNQRVYDFIVKSQIEVRGEIFGIFDNDILVGVGSIYQNEVHPYRDYISMYIDEKYRSRGFGDALFNVLKNKSSKKKYQCFCFSNNHLLVDFLEKRKFRLARQCYNFYLCDYPKETSESFEIKLLKDISKKEGKEFTNLIYMNYIEFHKNINPLSEDIDKDVFYEKLIKPCDTNYSSILVYNGAVSAYMITYVENDVLEIGYMGGKYKNEISLYIEYFKSHISNLFADKKSILFEVDTIDYYAFSFMQAMNVQCNMSYNTYVLD